jgi:hypothetical protein
MTSRNPWARARTLADLGELTARWLEGDADLEHPDYPDGPDPETSPLIPVLAAANRVGIVTTDSQPGDAPSPGFDGAIWAQRPAVLGVTSRSMLDRLIDAQRGRDMIFMYARTTAPAAWECWWHPITVRDSETYTRYGLMRYTRHRETFGSTRNLTFLRDAWQFYIIDRDYEDRLQLWDLLGTVAAAAARIAADNGPEGHRGRWLR